MNAKEIPLDKDYSLPRADGGGNITIRLKPEVEFSAYIPHTTNKVGSWESNPVRYCYSRPVVSSCFIYVPKKTLLIKEGSTFDGIEIYSGKWKKVKKLTAKDIPSSGLKVRSPGAIDKNPWGDVFLYWLPSEERTLKLNEYGEVVVEEISSP